MNIGGREVNLFWKQLDMNRNECASMGICSKKYLTFKVLVDF